MKKFLLLISLGCSSILFSQKMITRSGEIKFEASMPAFEEVAAKSSTASCVFDKSTGEIAVLVSLTFVRLTRSFSCHYFLFDSLRWRLHRSEPSSSSSSSSPSSRRRRRALFCDLKKQRAR